MQLVHLTGAPPYYTNCFLVISAAGHAAVIDPAAPAAAIEAVLSEQGAALTHILLTHGHFDHVPSLAALRKAHGATLCMFAQDAQGTQMLPPTAPDHCFADGETLQLDELTFQIIHTPGHTLGSCCILCGDAFFTGDTLFAQDIGRTDFAESDPAAMRRSLQKLAALPLPDGVQVLPGHEEFSTFGCEKAHNPYLSKAFLAGR